MSNSEKIGNKMLSESFIHFTAVGKAICGCTFVCVGEDVTKNLLGTNEINVVRSECFNSTTCAYVIFKDVQVKELHNCR